jgi:predicted Ser/Thr protein kinase
LSGELSPTDLGDRARRVQAARARGGPRVGAAWGRYQVEALLGEGGMGRVWRAWDPLLRRAVALKCLRQEEPGAVERLLLEAQAQARVAHEHVCKVYEVGEVEGTLYIAMQLIAGCSLKEAAAGLSLEQKARVVRQAAEGVHAAHRTGLIHRDLKPANILVERGEDGDLEPFVVDFGVVRELAAPGMTRTGMAVGSIFYMAPEQARGLPPDRRVDVWGLGATLYELLTGQPPFGAGLETEVLVRLMREEPTPLARRAPEVPADLATVVMKCLQRDPARRYDSARALAADLQRYLDGEPVRARPVGWTSRAARRLRRHPGVAGLIAASLLAVGALGGLAWRAQWRSREAALAAQRFGRQAQEIEGALRVAYLLPLHDVRPDREQVLRRMRQLEAQRRRLGDLADAPGRYALGRGYLALDRLPEAHLQLAAAWRLGYTAPEVAFALGRVLAERYRQGLAEAAHEADPELRQARRRGVERSYLAPARAALGASRGAEGESRHYLLALVAFCERRYGDAARLARRAFAADRSRYEAAALAGDIELQMARDENERGEHAAAWQRLGEARQAYGAAAEVARSAPVVLADLCALETATLDVAVARGDSLAASFEPVRQACGRALAADPGSPAALTSFAQAHLRQGEDRSGRGEDPVASFTTAIALAGRALAADPRRGEALRQQAVSGLRLGHVMLARGRDPRPWFERALAWAGRAAALEPGSAVRHADLGFAYLSLGEYEIGQGLDPGAALAQAARSFRAGLAIDSSLANLHHRLAYTLFQQATYAGLHGADPRPLLAASEASYRRTLALNPRTVTAYSNLGNAYVTAGQYELDHGLDPRPALAQALASYRRALALQPQFASAHDNLGAALLLRGLHEAKSGADPRSALAEARRELLAAAALNPSDPFPASNLAEAAVCLGDYLVSLGASPDADLAEGRRQASASLAMNPNDAEVLTNRADLDLVAARWELRRGRLAGPPLASAEQFLRRALAVNAADARIWTDLAEIELMRARPAPGAGGGRGETRPGAEAGRGGAGAGKDLTAGLLRGLAAASKASALNPQLAKAERIKGELSLLLARTLPEGGQRREALENARRALARAALLDPSLGPTLGPLIAPAPAPTGR